MKATILVRDLVKLIAKRGDPDTKVCISFKDGSSMVVDLKCADEACDADGNLVIELYGEEK